LATINRSGLREKHAGDSRSQGPDKSWQKDLGDTGYETAWIDRDDAADDQYGNEPADDVRSLHQLSC
jgi:hypothetical protein